MSKLTKIILIAFTTMSLTACGGDTQTSSDNGQTSTTKIERSHMDDSKMAGEAMDHDKHEAMNKTQMAGEAGHSTGIIVSISPNAEQVTINHQEIAGIGMGAMTMGFEITSAIDLSAYEKGDNVSFMVKKGSDRSYQIMAMCNMKTDGDACLDAYMDGGE